MTFFIDANVIVYSGSDDPERHAACEEILAAVARGVVEGRTSTAVLEEVWHLELTGRAGAIAGISERAYAALAPLLPVTDEIFRRALGLRVRAMGANDRIHAATALAHGIGLIVSADAAFDGVPGLRRVDPLDARAQGLLQPAR